MACRGDKEGRVVGVIELIGMGLGVGERARCRHASTVADMLQQLQTCFNNSGGASHRDSGAAQPIAPAYTAAHTPPPLQTPQAPGSRCTWPPLDVLPGAALVQLEAALVRLDPELQPRPACAHVREWSCGRARRVRVWASVLAQVPAAPVSRRVLVLAERRVHTDTQTQGHRCDTGAMQQVGTERTHRQAGWHS